jgi:hypothetical protein
MVLERKARDSGRAIAKAEHSNSMTKEEASIDELRSHSITFK